MIAVWLAWILSGPANSPVPMDVAMAVAWTESRGETWPVSNVRGSRFCSIWQTHARDQRECDAMRSPVVAALAFRREMTTWLHATRGDVRAALRGYGCGWSASRPGGQCRGYDVRVLHLARRTYPVLQVRAGS